VVPDDDRIPDDGSAESRARQGWETLRSVRERPEPRGGRRVEIMLDDELYDQVRIKAMRQRKSLRRLGAELFAAWVNDESDSRHPS
jgi:hypothetical protein